MGFGTEHATGSLRDCRIKRESTFGTFARPTVAAPGSVRVLELNTNHDPAPGGERIVREYLNSTSVVETQGAAVTGKKTVGWSAKTDLIPSGAAGTAPEAAPLLLASFGASTNTPSTSEVYTISPTMSPASATLGRGSMTIDNYAPGVGMQTVLGAFVEEWEISQEGPVAPTIEFKGKAKDAIQTGTGVVASISTVNFTLGTDEGKRFEANSVVRFVNPTTGVTTDDNGGEGFLVSSVAGEVVTLSTDPGAGPSVGDRMVPHIPAASFTGTPLGGTIGSITITPAGGSGITPAEVTSIKAKGELGVKAHDDVVLSATVTDVHVERGNWTCALMLKMTRADWQYLSRHRADPSVLYGVVIVWGSTAGKIVTLTFAQAELVSVPVEWKSGDVVSVGLNFRAKASLVTNNNACQLAFT